MAWTFSSYWKRNGREINKKRRRRYHNDDAYRKVQQMRSRNYYRRKKKKVVKANRKIVGPGFYSIGQLSENINRAIQTIRAYHRKGILPEPKFTDKRGWRLYSKEDMLLLKRAFKRLDQGSVSLSELSEYVKERWEEVDNEKQ